MNLTSAELAGTCLKKFAAQYRLKVRQPTRHLSAGPQPDMPHIPGKHGWIRALDSGNLRLVFIGSIHNCFRFHRLLREAKEAGMVLQGRGDYELMATFDPENDAQVKLALWAIQARRRRISSRPPSLAQIEARKQFSQARRMPVPELAPEQKGHSTEVQA